MSIAIRFDNISKQYRLGFVSTKTLSHDLNRWWQTSVRGKEDPYLKIGEVNNRATKGVSEYVWALRDINFEVEQGDVLGIIGKNGAGKSTLLKILSKVTSPTTGSIKAKGRIASLLEVGTGFHPEMTGRENIFMNGAIMGMTKKEISRKLDEIVDFSGVERYLDTPVKRYSSGMTVRLGFAIAAHLDPEILVVDEVLAVGDAEFQKKAIGKMQDVSKGEGRTVLFVSHNMAAVKNLCKTGILLKDGSVQFSGQISDVVDQYLSDETTKGIVNNFWDFENAPGMEKIRVKSAYVQHKGNYLTVKDEFDIVTEFWNLEEGFPVNVSMHLYDINGQCVYNVFTENKPLQKGLHKAVFHIPANLMNDGIYYVNNMFVSKSASYFNHEHAHSFEILEDRGLSDWHGKWRGVIRPTFITNEYSFIESI
ncbi:MAG: ATP-binding cassette domain-containing protein [Prevotellaceae bacterium]|jgi:lipopolysaccharide transport system ATP-binding protein|nr:ATP-binding cassette domain-containing protein [Prevotellaceae bacterium]